MEVITQTLSVLTLKLWEWLVSWLVSSLHNSGLPLQASSASKEHEQLILHREEFKQQHTTLQRDQNQFYCFTSPQRTQLIINMTLLNSQVESQHQNIPLPLLSAICSLHLKLNFKVMQSDDTDLESQLLHRLRQEEGLSPGAWNQPRQNCRWDITPSVSKEGNMKLLARALMMSRCLTEPTLKQQSKNLWNILSLNWPCSWKAFYIPRHFQEPKPVLRKWKQRCEFQASLDYQQNPVSKSKLTK